MLRSASEILKNTEAQHLLSGKRPSTLNVYINGQLVQIRDHKPLIEANIELMDGCSLDEFITELNSRVFLWAGTDRGPCSSGRNHISNYQDEGEVVIIKVPTLELLEENGAAQFQLTFCNSGSARQNNGQKARRGKATFHSLNSATRRPGEVVEFTFLSQAKLPSGATYAKSLAGPWSPLKTDA